MPQAALPFMLSVAVAILLPLVGLAGNCGLTWDRTQEGEGYAPIQLGEDWDIEDRLWSLAAEPEDAVNYKRWKRWCAHGDGPKCISFGVRQWNQSWYNAFRMEGIRGKPCNEDAIARQVQCGVNAICKRIDGKVRIVGIEPGTHARGMTREHALAWFKLPHLHALRIGVPQVSDFSGLILQPSVQMVQVLIEKEGDWPKIAAIFRAQGNVRSIHVSGVEHVLNWVTIDLAELCGLDLLHFAAHVIKVAGNSIPDCWSSMTSLSSFYCTDCMMTKPPTALRGMLALRSFIAFRQSEMVPCAVDVLAKDPEQCKVISETRHALKDRLESTGSWNDFQEGPSVGCPESAYAFPFKEFLDLGWRSIEKVWLDGNFLTGPIPENIGYVWPNLRSLDLYDNRMDGPIPESLGSLDMVKLQLQDNNFSGTVPKSVMNFLTKDDIYIGLAANPHLDGCLPNTREQLPEIKGSGIRCCEDNCHREGPSEGEEHYVKQTEL